ncbi:MAG: diguanylate cyclase [Magnetococcales bacterium]|nr:diguanylate cyclase [Magnetococcales bacterium]
MAEILVVDDDSQVVEQTARLIADSGHTSDFLMESRFLVPKLESRLADLVLLDVNMPDVDGLTLLKALKSHPTLSEIPVIMVTGETEEKLISQCFEMGAVDFIHKPIRPLELQSRVRIALETRQHILSIKKKNEDLKRAKAFSDTVLNSMEDAIVVLKRQDLSVVDANESFLKVVGQTRKALMGSQLYHAEGPASCYPCNDADDTTLLIEMLRGGETAYQTFSSRDEHNEKCYTKVITIPIDVPGKVSDQILLIGRDITKARLLQDKLKHLAFHDVLTGLPNRQLFYDRIHQSLAMSRRHNKRMAIMFFDLDRFKQVNDTLGHDIGDLLLIEVARRLITCIRKSDTIARLGGDEFTAILNEVESVQQVHVVAEKILKSLAADFFLSEHTVNITSSIGVALFPQDGENMEMLTKHADKALYAAKAAGRNMVQFFAEISAEC